MTAVRISLFWRTFLLIAGLVIACLLAMVELIRVFDPAPAEQKLAWEVASVVNLTRSALISAQSDRRRQLLAELAREEGVRVAPLEPGDRIAPLAPAARARALHTHLRTLLGSSTRLAASVNQETGLWVSFDIDGDPYWLGLAADRFERHLGPPWWVLLGLAVSLALLGALAVSAPLNKPLARLAGALGRISRGQAPPRLPEAGPTEIANLNQHFNRMVADLSAFESDRVVALAGISHDIRTPLTRLRMEIELSALPDPDKHSMSDDIARIDTIVGKFMEYARTVAGDRQPGRVQNVLIADLIADLAVSYRTRVDAGELDLHSAVSPSIAWRGDPLDLTRMLGNLIENGRRYARTAEGLPAELSISADRQPGGCLLRVTDRGPGIPPAERERLLRPFSRLDPERGSHGGSGLGLAIVARLAQRYGGRCVLHDGPDGRGLSVHLDLPDSAAVTTAAIDDSQSQSNAFEGSIGQ